MTAGARTAARILQKHLPSSRSLPIAPSTQPHTFIVSCARGLEVLLRQELEALQIGKRLALRSGGVLVQGDFEGFCRAAFLSRTADRVLLAVEGTDIGISTGDALFQCWTNIPWRSYLAFDAVADIPRVKVVDPRPGNSTRLTHYIKKGLAALFVHKRRVLEELGDYPDNEPRQNLDRSGGRKKQLGQTFSEAPQSGIRHHLPSLYLIFFEESAQYQTYIDATGLLGLHNWRTPESRASLFPPQRSSGKPLNTKGAITPARLLDSHAAALISCTPVLQILDSIQTDAPLVLWDPYCSSGNLLFETMEVLLGLRPHSNGHRLPFESFPMYREDETAQEIIQKIRKDVRFIRHRHWRRVRLCGSSGIYTAAWTEEESIGNLHQFVRRAWPYETAKVTQGASKNLDSESFKQSCWFRGALQTKTELEALAPNRCLILTALPYVHGSQQQATFKEFSRFINQRRRSWEGVFVVAPNNSAFKCITGLQWITRCTFESGAELGGGAKLELLEWAGSRS